jgi:hypothetical protein
VDHDWSQPSIEEGSKGRSSRSSKKGAMSSQRDLASTAGEDGSTEAVKSEPR